MPRLLYVARHAEADLTGTVPADSGGTVPADSGGAVPADSGGAGPADSGGAELLDEDDAGLSAQGRRQARLLGERLAGVPFGAVWHSPLRRAAQTAELVSAHLPGVPVYADDVVGDYPPSIPGPAVLPPALTEFMGGFSATELTRGSRLAAAAIARFTHPEGPPELIVTHGFLVGWLVRHALEAPEHRWLGLNAANAALTVIKYRPDGFSTVLMVNDMSHLPPELQWTGFPENLRP